MFKRIYFSAYFLKGKFVQSVSCSYEGRIRDLELQGLESEIAKNLLEAVLKTKPEKKGVYFVQWEGSVSDDGSLKKETSFSCDKMPFTPAEFNKADKEQARNDKKELERD